LTLYFSSAAGFLEGGRTSEEDRSSCGLHCSANVSIAPDLGTIDGLTVVIVLGLTCGWHIDVALRDPNRREVIDDGMWAARKTNTRSLLAKTGWPGRCFTCRFSYRQDGRYATINVGAGTTFVIEMPDFANLTNQQQRGSFMSLEAVVNNVKVVGRKVN
jgi:hypothetical protein